MQMLHVSFVSASGSNDGYFIEESDGNVLGIGNLVNIALFQRSMSVRIILCH